MRRCLAIVVALAGLLVPASSASAITGNFVEDHEHPYVGLVAFYDAGGRYLHRCSGSLLTDRVFLTAGHCVEGATSARIWFDQDAGEEFDPALGFDPDTGYPLRCLPGSTACATSNLLFNYGFSDFAGFPNTRDVGLIILPESQAVSLPEYGVLAGAGFLDRLATQRGQQETTFTVTGYGLSLTNPVKTISTRERLMAETKLVNLRSALASGFNLQLSSAPANGRGGTCFGDSGGPVLYGGFSSNLIVGVNSFVLNGNCRGTGFAYRTDTRAVLDWILGIVGRHAPGELREIRIREA